MKPTAPMRSAAWIVTFLLVGAIFLLVWYLPLIAAMLFIGLTVVLAVARALADGFWKGSRFFIKEILFGMVLRPLTKPLVGAAVICAAAACGCRRADVGSSSMSPTITNREKVTIDYTAYVLSKPKRWDVVVFDGPNPIWKTNWAAKRVVGLPMETISFTSNTIIVSGRPLRMPPALSNLVYVPPEKWPDKGSVITFPYTVPSNHYFVLGDSLANSLDSRYYGAVSETNILGRVKNK